MISILLDKGAALSSLSPQQMSRVKEYFTLYLVQAITFREAMAGCVSLLDYDQSDLRIVIRERLSTMIGDPHCNTVIKPAIILLARGNSSGFTQAKCNPRFTSSVIQKNRRAFNKVLRSVQFQPTSSKGLAILEDVYLNKVQPHAKSYVMHKAKFLLAAEHGLSYDDMINDLLLLALRAFRWYWPFRSGLHMLNTMRATISNRGKSMVKYNVADSRRRLIMLPSGEMYNREASGGYDAACNSAAATDPAIRDITIDLMMHRVAAKAGAAPVVKFVTDEAMQDRFVSWVGHRLGVGFHSLEELADHIAESRPRLSYTKMVAKFLGQPHDAVSGTLSELRHAMQ